MVVSEPLGVNGGQREAVRRCLLRAYAASNTGGYFSCVSPLCVYTHPTVTGEKTEGQRGHATCPKSHKLNSYKLNSEIS